MQSCLLELTFFTKYTVGDPTVMRNFNLIVKEAAVVFPQVRIWTAKTLRLQEYSHSKEVRTLSQAIARADGILSHDAYRLMYIIALLHNITNINIFALQCTNLNRFLNKVASGGLHQFIIATCDPSRNLEPAGTLIRQYVFDADKLTYFGARGHKRIVDLCNVRAHRNRGDEVLYMIPNSDDTYSFGSANGEKTLQLIANVENVIDRKIYPMYTYIQTPAAKNRAEILMEELLCEHKKWKTVMLGKL